MPKRPRSSACRAPPRSRRRRPAPRTITESHPPRGGHPAWSRPSATAATASCHENAGGGPMLLIIAAALAAVTVRAAPLRAHEAAAAPDIRAWMDQYEAALNDKDLD